jgi:SAM-dependent methyltransferase
MKGDVQKLEQFADESFEIVHAHQCLLHVPDQLRGLQEMRRVAKTGGIVSTRDNTRRICIPFTPKLQKNFDMFDSFLRSRGAEPEFGERNHCVAHEAGFEWDRIEMSSAAWEFSGSGGREALAEGAKYSFRGAAVKAGLATEEEMDEIMRAWEDWGRNPEARFIAVDSALVCWK